MNKIIDLRSDTVTKPTAGMLKAMSDAVVGDDVFAEDPTLNRFQSEMAEIFGMEAGLFVPSGTMSNQLCLHLLTDPGDEVIIDELGHVYNYETGAAAHLSSIQLRPIKGVNGKLSKELIEPAIRTQHEWDPLTRVIAIENSTNKGGGAYYSKKELIEISNLASQHDIAVHLDGARIWNAMVASGIEAEFFGSISDTISICFSKGLGAPIGSMMLSDEKTVIAARRIRKMWGGGMRQAGLLAAAAEYGYRNHFPLISEDHRRAKEFAKSIADHPFFVIDIDTVHTNIVLFDVTDGDATNALDYFTQQGVLMIPFGPKTIRATFHFQVDDENLKRAIDVVEGFEN